MKRQKNLRTKTKEKGAGRRLLRGVNRRSNEGKHSAEDYDVRSQFTATVSHELRTPLSVIKEIVAMLAEDEAEPLSERQKRFLNIARSNVERLEKLISETLDLKALEQGRKTLCIRENSVGELFCEIERLKKGEAEQKGLKLIVQEDSGLSRINFDREQILECFRVLVDFSIRISQRGDILVGAFLVDNMLRMSVRAPSKEKPCDDLSKLFLRFEPLNEAEKSKLGRTGVEFARVREIVEKHRGKIWAEFLSGEGTFFHILLPVWEKRGRKNFKSKAS